MGKKFEVLAVEGRSRLQGLQVDLYDDLVEAIDKADFNQFNDQLLKFENGVFQKRKDKMREFISNFNKLRIKIKENGRSVELSPLQLAVKSGNINLVKFLIENNDNTEVSLADTRLSLLQDTLKVTAHKKDKDHLQVDIDKVTYVQNSTALHIAVAQGHMDVVQYLLADDTINPEIINLQDGEDLGEKDGHGNTPLHLATCLTDNWKIFDFLIAKGANREAKNRLGRGLELYVHYNLKATEKMLRDFKQHVDPRSVVILSNSSAALLPQNSALLGDDKNNLLSAPLAQALENITSAQTQTDTKSREVNISLEERKRLASIKYYLDQLEINIRLLESSLQYAQAHCDSTDTHRSAAITKIIEENNHIVKQATALIGTPNAVDAKGFPKVLKKYTSTMQEHAYAIGDYKTTTKVLFLIGVLALAIACAATGIGLAAEIGGIGFVGGYGAAANAAFSGGALAKIGSAAAIADGVATATVTIASAIPLTCGYLWHRHKTKGMRTIENISENAAALVKCTLSG
jgi:ankyrin repeat protein